MPQEVIVIFLLFVAVLAFAWFYLQRAKARTAPPSQTTETTATEHDQPHAG
jgi:hypothetical protein